MESCGLLSSSVLLSHANHLSPTDIALIKKRNAHISSTPSLELQMAMGDPACFDHRRDIASQCSLGVDCHNVTLASMPAEMRTALSYGRGVVNNEYLKLGKYPVHMYKSVQEVYALGTICGARAVGLEQEIGSLAVGKKADIIILDSLAPHMIAGAQHDPVTAIVMHSTPRDITITMVDGVIRKRDSVLLPTQATQDAHHYAEGLPSEVSWMEVAKQLLQTRETIQARIEKTDLEAAGQTARAMFGYGDDRLLDSLSGQRPSL
ncbi:hypothetical protein PV10_08992 [Exophiala mesophila]|uniref:Amidohydrolase-related domain-containing protein n=1 Tax=Exophiala mesophila TaxID=212818 RepID=A0A0D1YZP7_EXOME|nr:uncharacterized protein PV10_08992 [Exophiala mesophila]KIV88062.1 hypothetical protein PV10_08992 [Exophiala mesophila]